MSVPFHTCDILVMTRTNTVKDLEQNGLEQQALDSRADQIN